MKTLLTILFFSFCTVATSYAQEIKKPLAPKVEKEQIPASPSDDLTWAKGHWEWQNGRYQWIEGQFIPVRNGHRWMDGEWERNNKTGWWVYNSGYWQQTDDRVQVQSNSKILSSENDTAANIKEDTESAKPSGFFIKTSKD